MGLLFRFNHLYPYFLILFISQKRCSFSFLTLPEKGAENHLSIRGGVEDEVETAGLARFSFR